MHLSELIEDEDINRMVSKHSFNKGQLIVKQGEISKGLYFIEKGSCQLFTEIPGESEKVLCEKRHEGEFFAELSFIQNSPLLSSVVAVTRVNTCLIPHHVIIGLGYINPEKGIKLLHPIIKIAVHRIRQLISQIKQQNVVLPKIRNYKDQFQASCHLIKDIKKEPVLKMSNLAQLSLFKLIHHECLDGLINHFRFYKAKKNQLIFEPNSSERTIYYVISGALQTYLIVNERPTKLSIIGPGGVVGIMDFFQPENKLTGCIVREDVIFLKIVRDDLEKVQVFSDTALHKIRFYFHTQLAGAAQQLYMHYLQAISIRHLL